jgi:HemY protein
VRSELPPVPDIADKPQKLADLLRDALKSTERRENLLEGVAELGRLYQANGFQPEAEACWRILISEQPGEARWYYYLADVHRTMGDYEELRHLLRATTRNAPDYAPAWLRLATLEFKTAHFEEAAKDYERMLQLVPGDPYAKLGMARIAMQRGDDAQVRRLLEEIIADTPQFPSSHNLYAEILAAEGNEKEAARHRMLGREAGRFQEPGDPWLDELEAWCFDPKRLFGLGSLATQTNQTDRAKNLLERALHLAPNDVDGHHLLAELYLKIGEPALARNTCRRGIEKARGSNPPAILFLDLADAHLALDEPEEALRATRLGLEHHPDSFELYNASGTILTEIGRIDEAIVAYRKAVERNPNDPDSNFNLGYSLLSTGKEEEGFRYIRNSLEINPSFHKALTVLGGFELKAGRLESAAQYLERLYSYYPNVPVVRNMMTQWHWQSAEAAKAMEKTTEAERHYREGIAIEPGAAKLHAGLGLLLMDEGRFSEAVEPLEKLHDLEPANAQSSLLLGQLYARLSRMHEARQILLEGERLALESGNESTAAYCREILVQLPQ